MKLNNVAIIGSRFKLADPLTNIKPNYLLLKVLKPLKQFILKINKVSDLKRMIVSVIKQKNYVSAATINFCYEIRFHKFYNVNYKRSHYYSVRHVYA